jgi:hypothetical protein
MSVIKRPVRASQERPDWILDATGRAICVVCHGSREEDRTVAAEIVEALNGIEHQADIIRDAQRLLTLMDVDHPEDMAAWQRVMDCET